MAEYSEGGTPFNYLSLASTNATSVVARSALLTLLVVVNTTAVVYYLKLYDKASAPTVGTDVPKLTLPVPASTSGAGLIIQPDGGIQFRLGLAWALTAAAAVADVGVAATGVTINFVAR